MRGSMIFHDRLSALCIERGSHGVAHTDNAFRHIAGMEINTVCIFGGIRNQKDVIALLDHTAVSNLSAGNGIKRCSIQHNGAFVSCAEHITKFTFCIYKGKHFAFRFKIRIARKLCFSAVDLNGFILPGIRTRIFSCGTRSGFLIGEESIEFIFVNGDTALFQYIFG